MAELSKHPFVRCYRTHIGQHISPIFTDILFETSQAQPADLSPISMMTIAQEKLLWAYIDGECSKEEKAQVQALLQNIHIRQEYEEMLEMHNGFKQFFTTNSSSARIRNIK